MTAAAETPISPAAAGWTVGSLVRARDREWVVLPGTTPEFLLLQPLGGGPDDVAGVFPDEGVEAATFPPPGLDDLGDAASTGLLRSALRIGFTASAGPFRSLAGLAVTPRSYQYVPLMMALRQDVTRLLIADDVGIGKTIEAGLITAELLAQGTVRRFAVLCSPALAEQWQTELAEKFGLRAELLLTSTVAGLERDLMQNESLFDRHPHLVVSTDFIKSDRRRHEFLLQCPELVIVDEAHTCVAAGGPGQRARHQRYDLLVDLAKDFNRHLILATATPHSGDETAFARLLGLLDAALETADLSSDAGRRLLARHFVQRRRPDIRRYLDEDTPFPADRQTWDIPYSLSAPYAALFDDVLAYAREQVRTGADGARGRVRWWSALALLRALASSPAAAAATLRTRASNAEALTVEEADALGRAGVLDSADDETLEGIDATPGASIDGEGPSSSEHRRLREFARRADELDGPHTDRKLRAVTEQVRELIADGYSPIVFCRFLDTADYLHDHLARALAKSAVTVAAVTGLLPPTERQRRVAELADHPGQHVLVATDCLSEGVNLQEAFSAVVHYDLAWNPTRHEQREGRVDRYGQRAPVVRAVTLYGEDNGIDRIVLDVLIRRHRAIAKATGVAVPVPGNGDTVITALAEGLLLTADAGRQLTLDVGADPRTQELDRAWQSAAEKERVSRTKFAQNTIKPEEVVAEVTEVRRALGQQGDAAVFTTTVLAALGSTITPAADGHLATRTTLPLGLRSALVGHPDRMMLRDEPPAGRGEVALVRTDPAVKAIARYVLESALDPQAAAGPPVARRGGVMRTAEVTLRTTVLLVRFRFRLTLPGADGSVERVAEDARVLAFEGAPAHAVWLPDSRAEELMSATPAANLPAEAARVAAARVLDGLPVLADHLERVADELAERLHGSHSRVRASASQRRAGLRVVAQRPVDILAVQVLLPAVAG